MQLPATSRLALAAMLLLASPLAAQNAAADAAATATANAALEAARIMKEAVSLEVPSKVDTELGPSWGEARG